ncbi:MAG: thioredoxin family protein [Pedobacter sp.]|jgi:thiol:disulfide interchange protein
MKNLLLIIIIPLLIAAKKPEAIRKNGIHFFSGSWEEAIQKAQKENKPIFLDLYATWCGPCKLLKINTFSNKSVGELYNNSFINVSLNGDEADGALLAAKFQIRAYPALLYLDKNGSPVIYAEGYIKPSDFIRTGKEAIQRFKKQDQFHHQAQ